MAGCIKHILPSATFSLLVISCLMWVQISIRNLGIFLLSVCDFRENRCQNDRTVLIGRNLNCIYVCTVKRYAVFTTKYALETSVTSQTACLKSSSVLSSRLGWRKRDLTAVQHIQLRAHTVTQTRAPHHSGS
jgi:hypothetical protein